MSTVIGDVLSELEHQFQFLDKNYVIDGHVDILSNRHLQFLNKKMEKKSMCTTVN